ncbi:hypothetical protein II906_08225 [bacterium]|nr:hypothetical protein [bacterium]
MLGFRKLLSSNENKIYNSKQSLFWYTMFSYLPFCATVINLCICICVGFKFFPGEIVLGSLGLLFINIFFNLFCSKRFIITNENLKIIRTTFLTKVDNYTLSEIQGLYLEESYRFRGAHSYIFKIKFNNVIKKYRFYDLSQKSIEMMKNIKINKDCDNAGRNIESYYVFSLFFIINIINVLFTIYFLLLYIIGLTCF